MCFVAVYDKSGGGRTVEKSYMIAYRNLAALRDELGAKLFINPSEISRDNDFDVIICGFGSMSCEKDLSTDFLVRNDKARLFWLVGDYEQSTFAPLFYCGRKFEIICTFDEYKIKNKMMTKQNAININAMLNKAPNAPTKKKYDCIYYGRWRPDRLKYFMQYLDSSIHLSTAKKNLKMFHHNGCNPVKVGTLSWTPRVETLNLFRASLYIEDEFSHKNYTCLGNRFYEALWCNVVPLFDASCSRTLEKSGYKGYEWHLVSNTSDIKEKIKQIKGGHCGSLSEWQAMAIKEKSDVMAGIKKIIGVSACADALHSSFELGRHSAINKGE